MSDHAENLDRLLGLVGAVCDDSASPDDLAELDSIVQVSREARDWYLDYCQLHNTLILELSAQQSAQKALQHIRTRRSRGTSSEFDAAVDTPVRLSSVPTFPVALWHGTATYLSSGWPVAYLAATVVVGIGLWIGSLMPAFYPQQIANRSSSTRGIGSVREPQTVSVGRVTGMAECRWASGSVPLLVNEAVPVGHEVNLESGLMEITYDSGAKVILQGPVTYEVESSAGGFLSVGKLTARVEKKVASGQWPVASKSEISNPQSLIPIPNPSLATGHWPLFTIATPTATVTDLGTEFGVEVDREGGTTSRVFQGLVRVQAISDRGRTEGVGKVLHENESARVDNRGGKPTIVVVPSAKVATFARVIPTQTIKTLDLVDVVAGGDGFSGRRGRGIDPTTGRTSSEFGKVDMYGDYTFHRVVGMPLVDGVFIPDGSKGPVQVDSAGHVFPDCPGTDNCSWINVWAGGALRRDVAARMSATLGDVKYFSPDHPALLMHANKGLTFDLDAIRRANPGYKILRFRGVTGNMEPNSEKGQPVSADIWVLVDGQVRFKRREINHFIGAMPVNIPIGNHDRFLTLSATDGGNSYQCDMIIFGDPRLELVGQN